MIWHHLIETAISLNALRIGESLVCGIKGRGWDHLVSWCGTSGIHIGNKGAPSRNFIESLQMLCSTPTKCAANTNAAQCRQLGQRTAGSSLAPVSNPDTAQHSASQMQPKTPLAEHNSAVQVRYG